MKEEGIEGDTSKKRRGGGLRKDDRKAYRSISFFRLELTTWRRVTGFQRWPSVELVCYHIHETMGAGSN